MSSRRDFIKTVLLASGAVFTEWSDLTALPSSAIPSHIDALKFKIAHEILRDHKQTLDFPRAQGHVDCIVVGTGVSGLAAAWRLKKEGRSFLVLEGEPVVGGAARSEMWRNQRLALGSGYFVTYEGTYKEIYDDIGLKLEKTGEDALWYGPEEMHVDWWTDDGIAQLPIPAAEKDAFKHFRDGLLKFDGLPDYPLSKAAPEKIAKYDGMTTRRYLEQYNSPELLRWMNQYNLSSCGSSIDEVNAYCFLNFYSSEFGASFDLPRYSFPGGIIGTTDRLRKHIGESHVRTNALVLRVVNDAKGVVVNYLDAHGEPRSLGARTAILATQKRITHNLVPETPKPQKDLCSQVRYAPYITVNLLCRKPLFPSRAFDIWFLGNDLMFTDMVDGATVQDRAAGTLERKTGPFTYCVYCPQLESERKHLQDPRYLADFAQRLAQNIETHLPQAREAIVEMRVFAWGHTMVIPSINSHATFHPMISRPVGNIFYANTDNDLSPSVESGIINGHDAAEQVIALMGKG